MPKNITVYTRPTCAPCRSLKTYLNRKGINFNEINIDEDLEAAAKMRNLGGSMVPMTLITNQDNTQQVISGLNFSSLMSALGR